MTKALNPYTALMKKIYLTGLGLLIALLFVQVEASAQASNDLCANATPIANGQTLSGTTVGAGADNVGFCGTSNSAPGVWYTITGNGQLLTLSTCNQASYDTKISVFSGSCGSLVCVGGNDDGVGCSNFSSELTISSVPNTVYYVLVHGFLSSTGTFDLTATFTGPPVNDDCSNATSIACGQAMSGSTDNATLDNASSCSFVSNTAPGVWYEFTGTGQPVIASLCSGTNYDSKLSVYTGSCASLTCVDGNDDACGLQSEVLFNSISGQSYYILVHGFGSATGSYSLDITCVTPPPNDNACDAIAAGIGATPFNSEFATVEAGEVSPGAGTGSSTCNSQDGWCSFDVTPDNSVWFTFDAPASGCVSIVADGYDSQVAVYEVGDCADFTTYTELAANDDGGDDIIASASGVSGGINELACLTPGATYYIQVDGYNGASSTNGELTIIDCGGAALSIDAGDCQTRFVGYAPAEADTNFLQACASGGLAPYTFTWSSTGGSFFQVDDSVCSNLAVQPGGSSTYLVTVTDARGCTSTDSVEVQVVDVRCGNNNNKIQICHYPPGNPNNPQQLCISPNAVGAHIDPSYGHSGCHLGPCNNPCMSSNPSVAPPPACVDLIVSVTTDRFPTENNWEIVDLVTNQVVGSRSFGSGDSEVTLSDTFCVDPTHCYEATIFDSFGDGICCTFGQGNWSVSFDGTTTTSPTAGSFSNSETISVGNCSNKSGSAESVSRMQSELLVASYPNPANSNVHFKFTAPADGHVVLDLFGLDGKRLSTLFEGEVSAGMPNLIEADISHLPTGVYIFRLNSSTGSKSGKIAIAR